MGYKDLADKAIRAAMLDRPVSAAWLLLGAAFVYTVMHMAGLLEDYLKSKENHNG